MSVDVVSRVIKARIPKSNEQRKYPIEFCIDRIFNGVDLLSELWKYWGSKYVGEEYTGKWYSFLPDVSSNISELKFSIRMSSRLIRILGKLGFYIDLSCLSGLTNDGLDFSTDYINKEKPEKGSLYTEQYEGIKSCCKKLGAVFEARTGFGKNTIITYLCSHYIGSGNILILGPRYSILEEIKARAEKYDVEVHSKPEGKVMYIHPQGFLNSENAKDERYIEWMKNVDMVLIDECESITNSIETLLTSYCTGYRYIYGFSATADKYDGTKLSDIMAADTFHNLRRDTYQILYYVGETGFYKKDENKFTLIVNYVDGLPREYVGWRGNEPFNLQYARMEKSLIESSQAEEYLKYILTNGKLTGTLLIPLKAIEMCEMIWSKVYEHDPSLSIGFWTAKETRYYDGNGNINNFKKLDNKTAYTDLKNIVDVNRALKVLICTSVGFRGVDFKYINDVLLCIGGNNGIINQIAGRLTRFDTSNLKIWLIGNNEDRNKTEGRKTPILDIALNKRIRLLKQAHGICIVKNMVNQKFQDSKEGDLNLFE